MRGNAEANARTHERNEGVPLDLILRSDPKDRVSKDDDNNSSCPYYGNAVVFDFDANSR